MPSSEATGESVMWPPCFPAMAIQRATSFRERRHSGSEVIREPAIQGAGSFREPGQWIQEVQRRSCSGTEHFEFGPEQASRRAARTARPSYTFTFCAGFGMKAIAQLDRGRFPSIKPSVRLSLLSKREMRCDPGAKTHHASGRLWFVWINSGLSLQPAHYSCRVGIC